MRVYACVCLWVCAHVLMSVCAHMDVHLYEYMLRCVHICVHMCVSVYMYVCNKLCVVKHPFDVSIFQTLISLDKQGITHNLINKCQNVLHI